MSLLKRGSVWWTYFYVDGIRHQASTGTKNRRMAEQIAQKLKDDAVLTKHSLPHADPDMTFGALAARFIANANPRPHHLDRLKHLLPYFADTRIGSVTKPLVREYRRYRHGQKRMTDATINRDVSVLRHLLYWAVDEGLIAGNPLSRIKLASERRSPKPVLAVDEERKLLAAAPPHLRDLATVALDTGMRRGELFGQQWRHVDFARGVLSVTRSKTVEGEGREIPLTSRALAILRDQANDAGLALHDAKVFQYRDRGLGTVKTAWKTALKRAALRHVRFHDLRHTFNTRLLEAGVLPDVRKALMGHSSGGGVHAQYTHIELPLKRKAIAALERWWQEQSTGLDREGQHKEEHDERAGEADAEVVGQEAVEEENAG